MNPDTKYLDDNVARNMVENFYKKYPFMQNIIDPYAGNGTFLHYLCRFKYDTSQYFRGFDTNPINIRKNFIIPIEKRDFLEYNYEDIELAPHTDKVAFIGMPPKDKISDTVKHIAEWEKSRVMAFVLPDKYRKFSEHHIFPNEWHTMEQYDIPKNSFILNGKRIDEPSIFQIWENREFIRWHPYY